MLLLLLSLFFQDVQAGKTTPSAVYMTIQGAALLDTNGHNVDIMKSGNYAIEFDKGSPDLAGASLGKVKVPPGRYSAVAISYANAIGFLVSGERYDGMDHSRNSGIPSGLSNGDYIRTIDSQGHIAKTTQGTTGVFASGELAQNGPETMRSVSYFAKPTCVPSDGKTRGCQAGDLIVTTPNLYITLDMFHAVTIDEWHNDPDRSATLGAYPYASFGAPGAAIHLTGTSSIPVGEPIDVTIIFGADGAPIYVNASGDVSFAAYDFNDYGFCAGSSFIETSEEGKRQLISYSSANGGSISFPVGDNGVSQGLSTITGFLSGVNSNISTTPVRQRCGQDNGNFLGYSYAVQGGCNNSISGHGADTNNKLLRVARIVDPNNILGGICTSGNLQNGTAGSCGSY